LPYRVRCGMFRCMTLLRRIAIATIVAALSHPIAAQTAKGSGYTTTITTDSGGAKHTMSIQLELLGSKMSVAMRSDAMAGPLVDMRSIFDTIAGTVTTIMPVQRMVMIAPRPKVTGMQPYTMELEGTPSVETVDLGAGETILGHATRHSRQSIAYTMKITVGGESCSKPTKEESEVWTTTEVQLPDLTAAIQRFTGATLPISQMKQLDSLRNKTVQGMMLRRIGTTKTTGPAGDTLLVVAKMELAALNPDSVNPQDFEIPADYRVMDMRETMANMDPGAMEEAIFKAQLASGDKMKATLCGASATRKP
jgi:hypothetical protein